MKELSIKEKAKRYDDAIKRAKDFMNGEVHYELKIGENIMCWIFPELKEGEDEKIRKSFIRLLKAFYDVNFPTPEGFEREDMIAWLEKQGKKGVVLRDTFGYEEGRQRGREEGVMLVLNNPRKYGLEKGLRNLDNSARTCKDGQNPAKCNEEKEEQKTVDVFNIYEKSLLEKFKQAVYNCAWRKVTCKVEGESKEEYAERWSEQFLLMVRDWADDYIDFTIEQKVRRSYDDGYKDAIKNLNSAWSEEDSMVIKILRTMIAAYVKDDEERKKLVRWLDIHCNAYPIPSKLLQAWKPSDEQMVALRDISITGNISYAEQGQKLIDLYNDLKKLREG